MTAAPRHTQKAVENTQPTNPAPVGEMEVWNCAQGRLVCSRFPSSSERLSCKWPQMDLMHNKQRQQSAAPATQAPFTKIYVDLEAWG